MKRIAICVLVSCLGFCCRASAQGGIITTVAGSNWVFPTSVTTALNAPLAPMASVVVDAQGNLDAADASNNIVVQVTPTGGFRIVAGNGAAGFSGDGGPATSASLNYPYAVAVDASGNLLIADSVNNRIRKVSPSGVITTFAGNGSFGFSGDGGPATSASLGNPTSIAVDASGNLFILDKNNDRIRKVSASGVITTVAGNGIDAFSGDGGPATSASLNSASGIALDQSGNLFIAELYNRVRKVSAASGVITTVAGNGSFGFSGDGGPATSASLNEPFGLALDASGNLFIADSGNNRIRKVSPSGVIATVAGSGAPGPLTTFAGDGGQAISASLFAPSGVAVDSAGNLYIADYGNSRIRKVSVSGVITTVAGNGMFRFSGDGGPATAAQLWNPAGVAVDASGNLFIADSINNRIRKVSASGLISTVAGNGNYGFSGDGGPATAASLRDPQSVAVDGSGNLLIADVTNDRIRMVSASTGVITTVAGNGGYGLAGDGGSATSASLNSPYSVAVDVSGNLFIADAENNVIRKVSPSGVITTVAGNGTAGFSGDGGQATLAQLNFPDAVAVDASGNLFIADDYNFRIRRVSASGIITTIAGNGTSGFSGDGGPATSASLFFPGGIAVGNSGNLFIADSGNRIRKVSASGIITTLAGDGFSGFAGDGGPSISAELNIPEGLALDASGNLFIADSGNSRIREVSASSPSAAGPSVPANGVVDGAGFSARISGGGIGSIFGTNLAAAPTSTSSLPLPITLGGTTVTMNGISVPLFFVSPLQINFQVPWEMLSSPTATLTVTTAAGTSPSIAVSLSAAAPGIFTIGSTNSATQGAIQIANTTTLVAPVGAVPGVVSRPGTTGDILTIYCSGLGAVTNMPVDGAAAGTSSLSYVQAPVSVTVGGQSATPLFAGLAPGFVGLYQVNVQLPAGVAAGNAVPVVVSTANLNSNTATIAVQYASTGTQIRSLTLSASSVASGGTVTGSVVLSAAAPSGGAVVALSSGSSEASVPATVTVPAGANSATFTISAGTVSSSKTVTITASYDGSSAQANLTVAPPVNPLCANVGGTWNASESGSYTETIAATAETDTETYPVSGNGSVTIAQTGCSISYEPITNGLIGTGLTPSQLASLARTGTVSGDNVSVTGLLAIVDTVASAAAGFTVNNVSSNVLTAVGQVAGNPPVITLNETGSLVVSGTYSISGQTGAFTETITTSSIATFMQGGIMTTVAGDGGGCPSACSGFSGDGGPAVSAQLAGPNGVAVDASGNLFIADYGNNRIRMVSPSGIITTVAGSGDAEPGNGGFSGDGGPATSALLNNPASVAVDSTGNLFIADYGNNRVRKVSPSGIISTVAGNGAIDTETGSGGFSGDGGPATSASLAGPSGVAVDASGSLFIVDTYNMRIRMVLPSGVITTVAGSGPAPCVSTTCGSFSGDGGPATSASLYWPSGVAVDAAGDIFIADSQNECIRKVSASGIITTVAGVGTSCTAGSFCGGFSGDGGPATSAELTAPYGVAVDIAGNLFIADQGNNRIREVSPSGIITTVAGTGAPVFAGDGGPATSASLFAPHGIVLDGSGNLFIADLGNDRVREVTQLGEAVAVLAERGVPPVQMGVRFKAFAGATVPLNVVISLRPH
jgi:uncharacterized protein (TIGR03437 family)